MTIRTQIVIAFLVCFAFMAGILAVNYNYFRRLSRSMQLFEVAGELNSTLLEMRRYEKNCFLYRQEFNFEENVTYTNRLALILQREKEGLIEAMGRGNYEQILKYVEEYSEKMTQLREASCDASDCAPLETQIRGIGHNLLLLADEFVTMERRAIDRLIVQMMPLPLIGLLMLALLSGFIVFFIGERVIRPLARITRESEAVAQGTFQRITPYGDSRNEIHHLVSAINRMMEELEKRQEQLIQSRKIASIGTLTAGIAHEINNPVNNLSLILESLVEDGDNMDNDERRSLYQEAMDQADRTSEIVKNLLEFSRASHPRVEDVDAAEVVEKTGRLLRNEMALRNIRFTKEIQPGLPRVRMDKGGLQQVLLNLLMNAIQAMESGGELKTVVGEADTPGEIRIDVIDNGPGIPPELIDKIFDPFFTTKKEGVGTGLGLSVSYNIIQNNGGRVELESQVGRGARFSIYLPLAGAAFNEG
jgi:signal transduction histidine kinase